MLKLNCLELNIIINFEKSCPLLNLKKVYNNKKIYLLNIYV